MKNNIPPDVKAVIIFRPSLNASGLNRQAFSMTKNNRRRIILLTGLISAGLMNGMGAAQAALLSACTGASLPKSAITNIIR